MKNDGLGRVMHFRRFGAGFLTKFTGRGYFWSHCLSDGRCFGGRHGPFKTRDEAMAEGFAGG